MLTSLNVSAQTALPDWVRARGLAVFLMVFFGSMALGSIVWGQVATLSSVETALVAAAFELLLGAVATRRFAVGQGETMDLSPASAWPQAPALSEWQSEDRPAIVTVEYRVDSSDSASFLAAIDIFARERLRDGATSWDIAESVESPGTWIETFHLPSWSEHLAQHERATKSDLDLQNRVRAFDQRPDGPVVRHYVKPH